jgi:DNA-binding MarR family transcriptional regulator
MILDRFRSRLYSSDMNESVAEIDQEIFSLLRQLVRSGRLAESRLDGVLGDSCLTATRILALQRIGQAESPLSLGQLAAQMAFVKSNVTQLVDRLEAENLVQRVPDPKDRRCTLVELTNEGRQHYQAGLQALQSLEADLNLLYTLEERLELTNLLSRLGAAWE